MEFDAEDLNATTLDEAVAFLVDCGFTSSESNPPSSENSSPKLTLGREQEGINALSNNTKSVSIQLKPRRRRTPKDEIEKLRRQVADLTVTRNELRRLKAGNTTDGGTGAQNVAIWESVAHLQRSQREQSEAKNEQLKKILKTQRRKTRNLRWILRSNARTDVQIMKEVFGVKSLNSSLVSVSTDNVAVFQELASKLDGMYLEVVRVAVSPLFPADWRRPKPCFDVVFVHHSRKVYPFCRRVADQAVWDTMGQRGIEGAGNYCINVGDTDKGTRTSSWRAAYSYNRVQVDVLIRKVARKFVTDSCTIVVCSSLMQPTSFGSISVAGVQYWEHRYVVIQPGGNPDKAAISCYFDVERHGNQAGNTANNSDLLGEYEMVAWQNLVAARTQTLENLLMEHGMNLKNNQ
ncbi:hypothetical protein DVH05_000623 [Phytophthora capsici]|nr:hypothetical protein DVH05_000623 [Phytophthora capsici]